MLPSGICHTEHVTHRELPYAESADLTTDRYRPRRRNGEYSMFPLSLAQFINELNARVEPCGTFVLTPKDCFCLLWWDFFISAAEFKMRKNKDKSK